MNKRQAMKRIVEYVIVKLENNDTCDDEKQSVSTADCERLCQAETEFAAELRRRYAISFPAQRNSKP
jgi:hypothetical protein